MRLSERINRAGVLIRIQDLPTAVHGICYHDDDQNPYIIINARMDRRHQMLTLRHELEHIEKGEMNDLAYREY